MLEMPVVLETGLPGPVTLQRITTADAVAFADHVDGDLARLREHLPWPEVTRTPDGAAEWLGRYERHEDGRVDVGGVWTATSWSAALCCTTTTPSPPSSRSAAG